MRIYIVLLAVAFLTGCSGGGSDSKGGGGGGGAVPGDIDFKVDTTQPLTEGQLREVQGYMKTDAKKLPSTEVLYNPKSDSQKRKKEEKLAKLDNDGRANLQNLKNNCDVQDSTEKKISGPDEDAMPKTGDVTITEETRSISGRHCPISHADKNTLKRTVVDFNYDPNTRTLNSFIIDFEGTSTTSSEMRTQSFTRMNNGRVRMNAEMSMNGRMEMKQKSSKTYVKALGSGKIDSANGSSVPLRVEIESLQRSENNVSSGKSATKFVLQFPAFTLVVQGLEETTANGAKTQKYFINGTEYTAQEFENLIGTDFSLNSVVSDDRD